MIAPCLKITPDPFLEDKPKRKFRWPIGRKIESRNDLKKQKLKRRFDGKVIPRV